MPDELLYGRAGYLSGLLYINANISPSPIEPDIIKQVLFKKIDRVLYMKDTHCFVFKEKIASIKIFRRLLLL